MKKKIAKKGKFDFISSITKYFNWKKIFRKNFTSSEMFGQKRKEFNLSKLKFRNEFLYLFISVKEEKNTIYLCDLVISRNNILVNWQKNIIFVKILKNGKHFNERKLSQKFKIQLNKYFVCYNINIYFIQMAKDFKRSLIIDKKLDSIKISFSFSENRRFTYFPFKISERYCKNNKFYSTGIYCGDELILKVDNCELILPENCFIGEKVISVRKCFSIEWNKDKIKFYDLLNCYPHSIKFLKPINLRMKLLSENPTAFNPDDKITKLNENIFEISILHFSAHGLLDRWNNSSKLTIFYLFELIEVSHSLKISFSLWPFQSVNVS